MWLCGALAARGGGSDMIPSASWIQGRKVAEMRDCGVVKQELLQKEIWEACKKCCPLVKLLKWELLIQELHPTRNCWSMCGKTAI